MRVMNLDLSDEETAALTQELHDIIERDRYPFSPRIRTLRVLAKLNLGSPNTRKAGCRYPIIETTPVIDRFRVGHGTLLLLAQVDPGQSFFNLIVCRARLSPSPG
jgi:hypothetical protein